MQSRGEESVRSRMAEMRLICEREIPIQQQRIDSVHQSFQKSLAAAESKSQETLELHARLGKLKEELREAENVLVKALAGKTRKEAKKMATMDSLSATKARVDELKGVVEDQRARKEEYAAIISQQSSALNELEAKRHQNVDHMGEIEEAIGWYNKVLGFRVECGHGVKFIFTNINPKNPSEEHSFTIRHENDVYTLLDCHPLLNGTNELMKELNKSNGLFRFVRTMREKFQEAAAIGSLLVPPPGNLPGLSNHGQDSSMISVSAPASSVSTDSRSESPAVLNELQLVDLNSVPRKVKSGKEGRLAKLSPGSIRRSPRFKAKK